MLEKPALRVDLEALDAAINAISAASMLEKAGRVEDATRLLRVTLERHALAIGHLFEKYEQLAAYCEAVNRSLEHLEKP